MGDLGRHRHPRALRQSPPDPRAGTNAAAAAAAEQRPLLEQPPRLEAEPGFVVGAVEMAEPTLDMEPEAMRQWPPESTTLAPRMHEMTHSYMCTNGYIY